MRGVDRFVEDELAAVIAVVLVCKETGLSASKSSSKRLAARLELVAWVSSLGEG